MDMNKAFILKNETHTPKWHVIDASGLVLGRLATRIADILRGKNSPMYTPHTDSGDYVVVVNCEKVNLTGDKLADKIYSTYSGWRSGLKQTTAGDLMKKDPAAIIELAVKGMLPKNKLNRQVIKKLKVYAGSEHPHHAQI
jgi:large subunit ribosomal protein L13